MTAVVAVAVSREYVEIWRTDDCAAYESVYADENGLICSELMIWSADGSRYREVIGGLDLTKLCRSWEVASPSGAVLVPDDAGRKVWTHLDPEPVAEPEPEPPTPAPAPALYTPPVRGSFPVPDRQRASEGGAQVAPSWLALGRSNTRLTSPVRVLVTGSTRMANSEGNRTANWMLELMPVTPQIWALCSEDKRGRISDQYQPRPLRGASIS